LLLDGNFIPSTGQVTVDAVALHAESHSASRHFCMDVPPSQGHDSIVVESARRSPRGVM
jgi:hypothetical protein